MAETVVKAIGFSAKAVLATGVGTVALLSPAVARADEGAADSSSETSQRQEKQNE